MSGIIKTQFPQTLQIRTYWMTSLHEWDSPRFTSTLRPANKMAPSRICSKKYHTPHQSRHTWKSFLWRHYSYWLRECSLACTNHARRRPTFAKKTQKILSLYAYWIIVQIPLLWLQSKVCTTVRFTYQSPSVCHPSGENIRDKLIG